MSDAWLMQRNRDEDNVWQFSSGVEIDLLREITLKGLETVGIRLSKAFSAVGSFESGGAAGFVRGSLHKMLEPAFRAQFGRSQSFASTLRSG